MIKLAQTKPTETTTRLLRHPLSALFGDYVGTDRFRRLVASVRTAGQKEPIVLYENKILDGWHRYTACLEAGVEPRFEYYEGEDSPDAMMAYVVAKNATRRESSPSQLGMIAARLTTGAYGQKHTQVTASRLVGASETVTYYAVTVLKTGVPELIATVEQGAVSGKLAASLIAAVPPEELKAVAKRGVPAIKARVQEIRKKSRAKKAAEKERQILARAKTSPGDPPAATIEEAPPPKNLRGEKESGRLSETNAVLNEMVGATELLRVQTPKFLKTPEGQKFGRYVRMLGLDWLDAPDFGLTAVRPLWKLLAASAQEGEHQLAHLRELMKDD